MNELLIPEDLLQLEKLKFEIELHDFDISFLGLIGIDTRELMLSFNKYFKKYDNIYFYTPSSSDIFNEILNLEEKKDKFIYINLFHYKTSDFIMKLLFFRDFIADYNLKLFFILNKNHYNLIIKNAIDFYNVSTFSYLFATYKVAVDDIIDRTELDETINEYRTKIKSLNKKQKLNFLYEIGYKCNSYGDYNTGLKYLLEALSIAEKVGNVVQEAETIKQKAETAYRSAEKLQKMGVVEYVVDEGEGAHLHPEQVMHALKTVLKDALDELQPMDANERCEARYQRLMKFGSDNLGLAS